MGLSDVSHNTLFSQNGTAPYRFCTLCAFPRVRRRFFQSLLRGNLVDDAASLLPKPPSKPTAGAPPPLPDAEGADPGSPLQPPEGRGREGAMPPRGADPAPPPLLTTPAWAAARFGFGSVAPYAPCAEEWAKAAEVVCQGSIRMTGMVNGNNVAIYKVRHYLGRRGFVLVPETRTPRGRVSIFFERGVLSGEGFFWDGVQWGEVAGGVCCYNNEMT